MPNSVAIISTVVLRSELALGGRDVLAQNLRVHSVDSHHDPASSVDEGRGIDRDHDGPDGLFEF